MKTQLKKWDVIIIGLLLILSFLPYGFIKLLMGQNINYVYAYITVEGEFYKEIPLTGQKQPKEYMIKTPYGTNMIRIVDEKIAVIEADCRDHICEQFGYKSKPGEVIVCLPHQMYIEIRGSNQAVDETIDVRGY